MNTKYPITFDAEAFLAGNGVEFTRASASLDGDWICQHLSIPFDRYYRSYDVQQEAMTAARKEVVTAIGFQLISDKPYDHGVILNASLFGGTVQYHANSTPVLSPVINDPADVTQLERRIDGLSAEALMHEGNLHPEYWMASERRESEHGIASRAPASGGTKGVATVCGQLCGVTNFLIWLSTNPAEMAALTSLVGRTFGRYIAACRAFDGAEDADGLGFASDLTGLMSPENYEEFCAPAERELYEKFAPSGVRFYHADSNMKNHVRVLKQLGVTDVNIGPMVSVTEILSIAPDMTIHGQVPPTQVLWQGSPDLVVDAVRSDIDETRRAGTQLHKLHICTAGSINPGTPLDNIKAMFWAAAEFGRYDGTVRGELSAIPVAFDRGAIVDQIS